MKILLYFLLFISIVGFLVSVALAGLCTFMLIMEFIK